MREALLQVVAHGCVVAQQVTRFDQQVEVVELAHATLGALVFVDYGAQVLTQERSQIRIQTRT